jgi:hypothetical protein
VIVRDNLVTFCIQKWGGAEMITIRYADLPEGLHARAEARGRRTTIYLRPGLTAEQRRLSLRRARQSARMGYGPRLPGPGVALAVARHVACGTLGNIGAAVRRHPVGFLLLSAGFAVLMIFYALFVTVSVRLMLHPARVPEAVRGPLPARIAPAPDPGGASAAGPAGPPPGPERPHLGSRAPREPGRASPAAPGPGPTAQVSPAPSPAGTPAPSPGPSLCVTVGPVGVCL